MVVAPFVGAWIEICIFYTFYTIYTVAPFVGAWIEMLEDLEWNVDDESLRSSERGLKFETTRITSARNWSLRSSERGLKYFYPLDYLLVFRSLRSSERGLKLNLIRIIPCCLESLRSSERGLKSAAPCHFHDLAVVAPFVGAWIEIDSPPRQVH